MEGMIPLSKLTEIAKLFRGDAGLKIKVIDDDFVVLHNNKYKIVVMEKTTNKNGGEQTMSEHKED